MSEEANTEDDFFTVDLTDYRPRRRRAEMSLDSWTHASSPLEHWTMATATCRGPEYVDNRTECQEQAWADHLRACSGCSREITEQKIKKFAASIRAEREAAA